MSWASEAVLVQVKLLLGDDLEVLRPRESPVLAVGVAGAGDEVAQDVGEGGGDTAGRHRAELHAPPHQLRVQLQTVRVGVVVVADLTARHPEVLLGFRV